MHLMVACVLIICMTISDCHCLHLLQAVAVVIHGSSFIHQYLVSKLGHFKKNCIINNKYL